MIKANELMRASRISKGRSCNILQVFVVLLSVVQMNRCRMNVAAALIGQRGMNTRSIKNHSIPNKQLLSRNAAPAVVAASASETPAQSADDNTNMQQSQKRQETPEPIEAQGDNKQYKHILAILAVPKTSVDRIANEAILNTALQHTSKLSVVLRCDGKAKPSLAKLRRYVGEVFSQLWDCAMGETTSSSGNVSPGTAEFADVVVYPNNLPNVVAEQWIHHRPDLDCICSHDTICGWISESALGRGKLFQNSMGDGFGGLSEHVKAVNNDRKQRNLNPVSALHVTDWPAGAYAEDNVIFIDDDEPGTVTGGILNGDDENNGFLGGAQVNSESLFECAAVGGTFDGMHYGHRKLLTLAISSVNPVSGRLTVGITTDDMLTSKKYSEYIPPLEERIECLRQFLYRLAPGMKNRINIVPISDSYGPPGSKSKGEQYDALVLSHETLKTGSQLNQYRVETLGFKPLSLLCTRRTEPFGMSSTALRKLRSDLHKP